MYLISACLCGMNCKYSGGNNFNEKAYELFKKGEAVLICPEVFGGLSTPRIPVEISEGSASDVLLNKGKVVNKEGREMTEEFIRGAYVSLEIAKKLGIDCAVLKSKSPSCGSGEIYDGTFQGKLKQGNGVTTELFLQNGIRVISEEEI